MGILRLFVGLCEFIIPVFLAAKYGVEVGIVAIFLMLCGALDLALKDMIDAEKEENQDEV